MIFESPSIKFKEVLDFATEKKCKIIYENIDNWETSLGDKVYDYDTLVKMLQKSTLVIATAKKLLDQTKDYLKKLKIKKDVLYLPNAVDESIFNPYMEYDIPKDFVKGKKTILYYGSLWGEWFDWDLVKYVATSNPTYSFIMIGNYKPINNIKKDMPKNIHFLGEKPQKELPAYLKYSDYTIIPFKVKEISDYVSPLKVLEYLSMNKPVIISTKMDISNYPNVYISKTKEEFNNLIKSNIVFDNSLMKDFVSNNSWDNRFEVIMDNLKIKNDDIKKFKNNISVVVLNYNNDGIIQRCIDSLIKYNERYNYEIIVVDNESTDGSYENIVKKYKNNKEVKIFKNRVNGCSSGRNLGVSKSKKDYIMFLDSDEYVLHKYWLDTFLSIIDKKNVGAVSWSGGWFNDEGITHIVLERLPYNYLEPNIIATSNIGYLSTCGLLMTRELFNEIKGFDENYDPTCFEDTDLSLKIRNKKKILYYSRYLGVFHTPHQTTKQEGNKEYSIQLNKNRKYFMDKWMNINPRLITKYNENKINYRSKKM